ncbi:substrate-binding domain-containing protein [Leucobacter allii]|uniref:Substrate-binding domain-containing protein n=1 Tax=Leucobacter allii TaxID=2932247 RepID=A0ABY4FL22_9MICO|nr:substrate-binding domain-containing protein [Leucobacter allii]UOQ56950.1 substrate-binding domain-containing protein [Leucobacter allii]UOR01421.1 substrate-binding domain-containing protein [Leucobacter allii]
MLKSRFGRWSKLGLAGVAATGALMLAACGSPAGAGGGAAGGGGSAVEEDELKVALVTHAAPGDTFWDTIRAGAEAAAERNNVELLYSSDPDGARQAQLVQQAVDQDVDGIVVTLAKADAMAGEVQKAVDAGIPVFSINAGEEAYKDMGVLAHFGQNEFIAGQAAAEEFNEAGAQKAICVIQEQGHVGLESRCEGFADTFAGSSEVLYVTGTDMTNVASTITSKLQTNADIDAVLTLGAPFAMTALDAIADAGSSAKLATTDLNADVYSAIGDGSILFGIDQQPFLQGYESVEAVRLYATGGYVLGGGQAVLTGPAVVNADNLDSVAAQFEGAEDAADSES